MKSDDSDLHTYYYIKNFFFKFFFQTDPYQVSFHIPLHRYLAAFTCQAVRAQGILLKDALPPASLLQLIMMHPLRIQVSRCTSNVFSFISWELKLTCVLCLFQILLLEHDGVIKA